MSPDSKCQPDTTDCTCTPKPKGYKLVGYPSVAELEERADILTATELFMHLGEQIGVDEDGNSKILFGRWHYTQDDKVRALRIRLLREEIKEYLDAEDADDLVEVVDGLLDIIVIAWGTLVQYVGGEKAQEAAREVLRSNLAKVVGPGLPKFREDGKIVKPLDWEPPNIAEAIGVWTVPEEDFAAMLEGDEER